MEFYSPEQHWTFLAFQNPSELISSPKSLTTNHGTLLLFRISWHVQISAPSEKIAKSCTWCVMLFPAELPTCAPPASQLSLVKFTLIDQMNTWILPAELTVQCTKNTQLLQNF